jgi:hypothetical protein
MVNSLKLEVQDAQDFLKMIEERRLREEEAQRQKEELRKRQEEELARIKKDLAEAAEVAKKKQQEEEERLLIEKMKREKEEEEDRKRREQDEQLKAQQEAEARQKRLELERKQKEEEEAKEMLLMRERERKLDKAKKDIEELFKKRDIDSLRKLCESVGDDDYLKSRCEKIASAFISKIDQERRAIDELRKALSVLDKNKMKSLLSEINSTMISPDNKDAEDVISEARRLCFAVSEKDFFVMKFKDAFQRQDVNTLQQMLMFARGMGIDEGEIRTVSMWLSQQKLGASRTKTVKIKNVSAVMEEKEEQNLKAYFSRLQGMYPLRFHPLLRDPDDFAKGQLVSKGKIKKSMLTWQEV